MQFDLTAYLKDRDYLVTVQRKDYGARIVFPEQHTLGNNNPPVAVQLDINTDICIITQTGYCEGNPVFQNRHEVPKYAMNPYVIFYTIGVCSRINYSPEMIVFLDENGNKITEPDFMAYMLDHMNEDEIDKEAKLVQVTQIALQNEWPSEYAGHAEELGVSVGFKLMRIALGEQDEETQDFMVG